MVGCMIESRVGILLGAHVVAAHPNITMADLDGATFLAADPVVGGAVLEKGTITIGPEPGIGVSDVRAAQRLA
jgi:L-alanine-DL-glutamate epimerase-like enolase superfamily enzyme